MRYLGRRNMLARVGVALVLNVVFAAGIASMANGALLFRLTSNPSGDQITIADQSMDDQGGQLGVIVFLGQFGDFENLRLFAVSDASNSSIAKFSGVLVFTQIFSNQGGMLTLEMTDTDFPPLPRGIFFGDVHYTASDGVEAVFSAVKSDDNLEFVLKTPPEAAIVLGPFVGPGNFVDTVSDVHGPIAVPYAQTLVAQFTVPAGGAVFGPDNIFTVQNAVPEPSALLLLGAGLIALGMRRHLRK